MDTVDSSLNQPFLLLSKSPSHRDSFLFFYVVKALWSMEIAGAVTRCLGAQGSLGASLEVVLGQSQYEAAPLLTTPRTPQGQAQLVQRPQ